MTDSTNLEAITNRRPFWKDPSALFVINIALVYAGWKIAHHFLITTSGTLHSWWVSVVSSIGGFYAAITSGLLNLFAQNTIHQGIDIIFTRSGKRIFVQEHCLAIPAMIVFSGAILLFTGQWKNKLWFVPLGLLAIMIINILRLMFLSLTFEHMSLDFYKINHSVVYVVITYALILLMIMWWMKKFADAEPATTN